MHASLKANGAFKYGESRCFLCSPFNRVSTRVIQGMTLYEKWHGNLQYLICKFLDKVKCMHPYS
nr:hypothetical protein Q903MT_gene1453 [Picea sitchensis]